MYTQEVVFSTHDVLVIPRKRFCMVLSTRGVLVTARKRCVVFSKRDVLVTPRKRCCVVFFAADVLVTSSITMSSATSNTNSDQ